MAKKIEKVGHEVNGIAIEQRVTDGFINATAMCVAHDKEINDWFRLKITFELFSVLAARTGIILNTADSRDLGLVKLSATKYGEIYPGLIFIKRGSPDRGGGVWLHPDLAIQLAQWCSPAFALQVSRWVRELMMKSQASAPSQSDTDRVRYRDNLKNDARVRMCNEVRKYLEKIRRYDDDNYRGMYFASVHDAINRAITGETAQQMRERLSGLLGRKVSDGELIRDYFPALELQRYISMCEATANYMMKADLQPLAAVEEASMFVLPAGYSPEKIDFEEHINLSRQRIAEFLSGESGQLSR